MKPTSPLGLMGAALVLAALVLTGCGGTPDATPRFNYTPEAGTPGGTGPSASNTEVAAVVNGQPIAMEAFQRELARWTAGNLALGQEPADQGGYDQQVLDMMIEQELIRQTAAAQGISATDEEVDAAINAMIEETGQQYFDSWLSTNYYTPEEFREVMRLDLLTSKLLAPVVDSVPSSTEHVHARHILVGMQEQAEEVLARLTAGEDFVALAAEYSQDVTTRDIGGDLGWFPRGGLLVPEVEEAAFGMQPGQTSGVVPSAWGFHVVQTLEVDPEREIEVETRQRLVERTIEQWQQSLRSGADIEYLVDFPS